MNRGAKIAIGVAVAYSLAIVVTVVIIERARDATEAEVKRLSRLGDNESSDLRALPLDLPLLRDACGRALTPGPPESLVSYAAPYPVELDETNDDADVSQPHAFLPRRRFEAMRSGFLDSELAAEPHYKSLLSTVSDVAFDFPWSWPTVADRLGHRSLRFEGTRYLVVSVVRAVVPVRLVGDKGFIGGVAILVARVLDAHDGSELCEGRVEAAIAPSVLARQPSQGNAGVDAITMQLIAGPAALENAFTDAIESAPLDAVCDAGGVATCEATKKIVAPAADPAR